MTMKISENHGKRSWQGLLTGLALALCLSAPAGAFGSGDDPSGETRGNGGAGDNGGGMGSFAGGGDETVGTLPSTSSGDGGGGALDPLAPWNQLLTPGGSLALEGSSAALLTTVTSLRGNPRLSIESLGGGRQRWTIAGDFELGLDLDLLAGSGLAITVGSELDAVSHIALRQRELGQVALSAEQGLDLPLVALVQQGQVPSGLTVTTVDGFGTATRLSVNRTRRGLVLTQRNALVD
jgi:hypothetical protein